MPTGAERRIRAPGNSRAAVRAREAAELGRVSAAQSALPPLSAAFVPSRPNRRQRAAAVAAAAAGAGADSAPPTRRFADLPLSSRTCDGLAAARFVDLTDVQRLAIPQALAGRDVLAAAPTGSGKTLAFVVPLLETLWRHKWSTFDGLGALVLAPTRELALQIFEVFRAVAKFHTLSAGLVIGGKDFEYEREKVARMNVLVATPGRLLHHMDCVPEFDCSGLQVLVLDEADRILDLGFSRTLGAILDNLPREGRQTMLFSATQTKSVKSLARLSLRAPQYVSVSSVPRRDETAGAGKAPQSKTGRRRRGEDEPRSEDGGNNHDAAQNGVGAEDAAKVDIVGTPVGLSQSYTIVEQHEKLSVLWSFIKTHLKSKVIVFLATGKQVRFVFESFCKLRPGVSLLHIHGSMKQLKRTDMYDAFCRTKNAVLFATDVASRGLDFPDVEWVVQVDCPDDVSGYIHRVGRTARFRSRGRAMLFLARGNEEVFLKRLESRKICLNHTRINPDRVSSITPRLAALVASNQELKAIAQRAFTFYLKSVHRQHDKEVFDAVSMDHAAFASSLGLALAPKITFKGGPGTKGAREAEGSHADIEPKNVFGYRQRSNPHGQDKKSGKHDKGPSKERHDPSESENEEDDVLVVRKRHVPEGCTVGEFVRDGDQSESAVPAPLARKRKRIKLDVLKTGPSVNRIVFTEDGRALRASEAMLVEEQDDGDAFDFNADTTNIEMAAKLDGSDGIEQYAAMVTKRLEASDAADKAREHERVRVKHTRLKERSRPKVAAPSATQSVADGGYESVSSEEDEELSNALSRFAARVAERESGNHSDGGVSCDLGIEAKASEAASSKCAESSDGAKDVDGPEDLGGPEDLDSAEGLEARALDILSRRRRA